MLRQLVNPSVSERNGQPRHRAEILGEVFSRTVRADIHHFEVPTCRCQSLVDADENWSEYFARWTLHRVNIYIKPENEQELGLLEVYEKKYINSTAGQGAT